MSDAVGAISYAGESRGRFLEVGLTPERGHYAEHTAQLIDSEVKRILTEAHDLARTTLLERRDYLETVTTRLLEREVMEGDELREILARRLRRSRVPPASDRPPVERKAVHRSAQAPSQRRISDLSDRVPLRDVRAVRPAVSTGPEPQHPSRVSPPTPGGHRICPCGWHAPALGVMYAVTKHSYGPRNAGGGPRARPARLCGPTTAPTRCRTSVRHMASALGVNASAVVVGTAGAVAPHTAFLTPFGSGSQLLAGLGVGSDDVAFGVHPGWAGPWVNRPSTSPSARSVSSPAAQSTWRRDRAHGGGARGQRVGRDRRLGLRRGLQGRGLEQRQPRLMCRHASTRRPTRSTTRGVVTGTYLHVD